jgi:branched-chain amino acid transport system permease protein
MLYREVGQFKTSYAQDMGIFPITQDRVALYVVLAIAFIGVPILDVYQIWPFKGEYLLRAILIPFLILSLAAIGLNILTGYCGQLSLGSGAFMAIGAYAAYKFSNGVVIGALSIPPLPVFVSFFFDWVFIRIKWFTNYTPSGSVTAPELRFFGFFYAITPLDKYLLCLAFVTVIALLAKNLVRGNIGRQWMATRDMDIAAELMGIRPMYAKLSAFAVSSFIMGIAGSLWAFVYLGAWEPLAFNIDRSFQILFMVIIGGLGSILGSFLGAAFILVLPILLDQVPHALGIPISVETVSLLVFIITGALICWLLIVEPHGFARLWLTAKEKLRLWPYPY